ncbi:dof zinc finger protein DOF3.1-like [Canna indica]|uniref:Dof zinc finger protein DOF3.1-like n=1 Tax=Canna indica TaxID=4628 RepID=A0AAQ3K3A1_9LILI|nr:dof zinc finger protein DOF3.1-like [Canna indica]
MEFGVADGNEELKVMMEKRGGGNGEPCDGGRRRRRSFSPPWTASVSRPHPLLWLPSNAALSVGPLLSVPPPPLHVGRRTRRKRVVITAKGGPLCNILVGVGGGTRKNSKRSTSSAASSNSKPSNHPKPSSHISELPKIEPLFVLYSPLDPRQPHGRHDRKLQLAVGVRQKLQSLAGNGSALSLPVESFDRLEGNSGCWAAAWTDLAIYNPWTELRTWRVRSTISILDICKATCLCS